MNTTRATVLVLGLFLGGVLGGAWAGSAAAARARDPYVSVDTLVRVLGLIETTYVDEIDAETLAQAAIDGMLDELDEHSVWMSAATYRDLRRNTSGSYAGVGIEVKVGPDGARITRVFEGGPASREGLAVGDVILAVDGAEVRDADDLDAALLGPRGSVTTLQVTRDSWDSPREIATTRDEVQAPAVQTERIGDVLWARLIHFRKGSAAELRDALAEAGRADAVLLDLRDNTGGLLDEAVAVADLFLDEGVIVSTWGRVEGERESYEATPGGLPRDTTVVVLVNGMSASASEVVAGALQDTERATLVGERTYGKGSVQSVFEHRDGSALKLTIGRYYTPSGEPVAPREGREPDVVVSWPAERHALDRLRERLETAALSDEARAELLALVDEAPKAHVKRQPVIPWDGPMAERLAEDPQLARAVELAR
jgi:carboxyl-terminal processing protease